MRVPTLAGRLFSFFLTVLFAMPAVCLADGAKDGGSAPVVLAFRNLSEGQPVHGFTLKDTGGADVALSSYSGKIVVAVFFRPDQAMSQKALADLERLYEKYKGKDVAVLAITPELNQAENIKALIDKEKLGYPVLLDEGRKVYGDWGVFVYPTTGILDKDARLYRYVASYDWKYADAVETYVRLALGEINQAQADEILNPTQVVELSPAKKKAQRHMNLAEHLAARQMPDKAAAEYEAAIESDPTLVEARVKYGFLLLKTGSAAKAMENFKKAAEMDARDKRAETGLGASKVALGDVDGGIAVLEDALKLNTKPALTLYELGLAYEKKGAFDKAAESYRKAIESLGAFE